VGRLVGGPSARSRISFGGNPSEREALEKQVLSMVANGVVTRLAEIARAQAAREKAQAEAEKESEGEE
jgi:outer membrane lipopolysaccharide assembly protein LptE/RlpB